MKLKIRVFLATCLFALLLVKPVAANDMIQPAVLTNQQALELVLASMKVWVEGSEKVESFSRAPLASPNI